MQLHGVINLSPDSAIRESVAQSRRQAVKRAQKLLRNGCVALDLGGQASTDFGAVVSAATEWERLAGPLEALRGLKCDISIDSWRPAVTRLALQNGATIINASDGLQQPEMLALASEFRCPVIIPFLNGPNPKQLEPVQSDPIDAMLAFFSERLSQCTSAGVSDIYLDPGLGFFPIGTNWPSRYHLQQHVYRRLNELRCFGKPLYVNLPFFDDEINRALFDELVRAKVEVGRTHFPRRIRKWEGLAQSDVK